LLRCPALFQEFIEARLDIRVTVIGQSLYTIEIESQKGSAKLDWRLDLTVPMRAHELPREIASRVTTLMRILGLSFGAIDLRLTPNNQYVFLEVNPGGQYLFAELLTGVPITSGLAEYLAAGRSG
jgi:glutathione synthase/RimK-type ligase-like ATP-grasp enzyme